MAEGFGGLEGIAKARIAGIPVGAAAIGALAAGAVDGVIGLVQGVSGTTAIPSWALKGVGSFASIKWGGRLIGDTAAQTAGLLLAYDAIQELVDLRGMVSGLFSGITLKHHSPLGITVNPRSGGAKIVPTTAVERQAADTVDQYLKARGYT